MKKLFTTTLFILFVFCMSKQTLAQQLSVQVPAKSNVDRAVSSAINSSVVSPDNHQTVSRNINPKNTVQNIFDIQFNYPLSFAQGVSCVYTGTEFWVGIWSNDTLHTLDANGNITSTFTINGVGTATSGVRALTFDGTFIYAGINTTSIKKINPATKTLVASITAPSAVRGLAYDSTANSGAGGFWISNFNTDFTQISMTGTVLNTITVAEHGVPGVYGIAFDPYTTGGPYLWAYGQGTAGDSAKLQRINIATHTNTGLVHNTIPDVAAAAAIAGSLSITWRYDPMHYTMMGCSQNGTNNLFGYELADYTPPAVDAGCNSIDFYPPYTQIPTFEISPMSWDINNSNNGTDPITDLATTFVLDDGTNSVYSPAVFDNLGVAPGSTAVASFASFTPPAAVATYNGTASIATVGQTDADASNDMTSYSMFITDTVMARDNSTPTGSLGLPDGSPGVLGQAFDLPGAGYVSSATFLLRSKTSSVGDSVNVDLYDFPGSPGTVLASTSYYTITAADTVSGVVLTLPFNGGPISTPAGSYFLGVNQTNNNISLATSTFNYRPGSAYFEFAGSAWQLVESNTVPFLVCYLLRMNILDPSVLVAEVSNQKFSVYPNPATSQITIESFQGKSNYKVELYDMIGNKVMEKFSTAVSKTTLDVSSLSAGMYVVKTIVDGNSVSTKVSIR